MTESGKLDLRSYVHTRSIIRLLFIVWIAYNGVAFWYMAKQAIFNESICSAPRKK